MNEILYFPSVRVAFNKTTNTIDKLLSEADKANNVEASKAYRACFGLIRQAILQIEQQGESSIHKHLDEDIQDLKLIAHECCTKIKECIKEQATLAFEGTKAGIIDILYKKGFDDKYIEDVMKEIDKIAEEEVEEIFSEEGIGFSE
jgi:deoxyxylulose-5-phosphate synthase